MLGRPRYPTEAESNPGFGTDRRNACDVSIDNGGEQVAGAQAQTQVVQTDMDFIQAMQAHELLSRAEQLLGFKQQAGPRAALNQCDERGDLLDPLCHRHHDNVGAACEHGLQFSGGAGVQRVDAHEHAFAAEGRPHTRQVVQGCITEEQALASLPLGLAHGLKSDEDALGAGLPRHAGQLRILRDETQLEWRGAHNTRQRYGIAGLSGGRRSSSVWSKSYGWELRCRMRHSASPTGVKPCQTP